MTPLAPPTEAEVKEMRKRAERVSEYGGQEIALVGLDLLALCDAYLAQRERETAAKARLQAAWETGCAEGQIMPLLVEVRETAAALSAAPLEDKP